MNPGIYSDISAKEYHLIEAVSNSKLGMFKDCPAKAKLVREDTPAMLFGRALHDVVLEEGKGFAIAPDVDKRTKAGKESWASFQAEHEGFDIITASDYQVIQDMSNAIFTHPFAKDLLAQGESEQTVIWIDEETGLKCKSRPDRMPSNVEGVFFDLKTTRSADEFSFNRDCRNYGYFRGASMYQEGLYCATGKSYSNFAFIVVEKEPPYRVEVYVPSPECMGYGYDEFHDLLRKYKQCADKDFWPHYQNAGAQELYLPSYLGGKSE